MKTSGNLCYTHHIIMSMNIPLEILYEDINYLAVNKPPGLVTHETLDANRPHLLSLIEKQTQQKLGLHHRLDAETSGVIIFAKTQEANKILSELFLKRQIEKIYVALVKNLASFSKEIWKDFVTIKKNQGPLKKQDQLQKVTKGGDLALLECVVLKTYPHHPNGDCSLLQMTLKTGRRHQIRAQAAWRGYPIIGDALYGQKEKKNRCLLHAHSFSFFDPITKRQIKIEAPIPEDFKNYIECKENQNCVALYKPYNVLSQFTGEKIEETLGQFQIPPGYYAAGRLDKDSEGLLILSQDGEFINKITSPNFEKEKVYWAQIEGIPTKEKITQLEKGIKIQDYKSKPCKAKLLTEEEVKNGPEKLPERSTPIRYRKNIPTSWLEITLSEGKNRQVRRMTAAIGHPTLRLIRFKIGQLHLLELNLKPGEFVWAPQNKILSSSHFDFPNL